MPAVGLPWTALSASRERRRWLRAAAMVCLAAATALAAGLASDPGLPLAVASGALVAGAALAWQAGEAAAPGRELRIDAEGAIWLRRRIGPLAPRGDASSNDSVQRALPVHVSGRLVTLRSAGGLVAVWQDSVPADAFRRLASHARWHVERRDPLAASGPAIRPPAA
jgi:hypothetical protein